METEPDFEGETWEGARNAIMEGGKSVEEAVEVLRQSWKIQHEKNLQAWNERDRQRRRSPAPGDDGGNDRPTTIPDDTIPTDGVPEWLGRPTPSFLDISPARHVLKRLEKKEFVELWHFTAQGCRDAAAIDLATPDDTLGLVNTEKGLVLQTLGASSVSSKVVKDENLSWDQMTEGRNRLLSCMSPCGWSKYEVEELARFYVKLDLHPIRSQPYGLQAILRYQENIRRDWTRSLKNGGAYAIGLISDNLMHGYLRDIVTEIQVRNNVSIITITRSDQNTDLAPCPNDLLFSSQSTESRAPYPRTTPHHCFAPHLAPFAPSPRTAPHLFPGTALAPSSSAPRRTSLSNGKTRHLTPALPYTHPKKYKTDPRPPDISPPYNGLLTTEAAK